MQQFDLFNQPTSEQQPESIITAHPPCASFAGSNYDPAQDAKRLTGQLEKIKACMRDAKWRTLGEIELITNAPQSSISAQLRNLRKVKNGNHTVNKRIRGERSAGLYEYQLILNS